MTFVLKAPSSYKWPVEYHTPADGGQRVKQTFDAEFLPLSPKDAAERLVNLNDAEAAAVVLIGWKGITDAKGSEVPFSEEAKEKLLAIPMMGSCLMTAYNESLRGVIRGN
jgi:hypothetical protein